MKKNAFSTGRRKPARSECRTGRVAKSGGSHVANVYTHTHALYSSQNGLPTGRGRVFPQHVTFATPDWRAASSGRHTGISTLWQPRPPRQWRRQSTTAAATTVSRRTLRERGQRRSFHKYSVRPATPALYPFTESYCPPTLPHRRGPTIKPTSAPGHPSDRHKMRIAPSPPITLDFRRARAPLYTVKRTARALVTPPRSQMWKKNTYIYSFREKRDK